MPEREYITRGEFEMFANALGEIRDAHSQLLKQGFEGVTKEIKGVYHRLDDTNERLDGVNKHLATLNSKTATNTNDIARLKSGVGDTQKTTHVIEQEIPSQLLRKKQTYMIAGAGTGLLYGLIELMKVGTELLRQFVAN